MLVYAYLLIIALTACGNGLLTEAADTGAAQAVKTSKFKLDIVSSLSNWQTLSKLVKETMAMSPLFNDIIKEAISGNPYLRILLSSKRPSLADLIGIATGNAQDPFKSLEQAAEHQFSALMQPKVPTFPVVLARMTGKNILSYQTHKFDISNVDAKHFPAREMLNALQFVLYNLNPILKMSDALKTHVISFDDFISNLFKFDFSVYEKAESQAPDSSNPVTVAMIKQFLQFVVAVDAKLSTLATFVHVENIAYSGVIDVMDNVSQILRIMTGTAVPA